MNTIILTARYTVLKIIRIYQKTLSFDHGLPSLFFPNGFCQFHPSCSEYGYQAIEKYGIIRGGIKALWRVLRCNPLSKGGFDPLK
ncbi:membrane protein insertion efficiency factor YidD [Candidatus Falkowbacteria bacterium RIFOXYB2_FULL_38_15]|uniref:Putative membrane protein insertion efficiency factor n=1 Tax=Candidatus Falkowbacteria bacterium RIFOXYA2_FULL_38_12 TaxID=1797993 RepID=A0A1F5S1Q1_9BACT|nr:MAG: membrane protein insertion efficiency factor YidD [Candidatus Falkowbacteria bacterium RIFOXYA2_FULL_38_12]OGF33090.1 MAG: membrane protein insertion efficiency factor YidD [Candidatus Falkowbacteria bacterium RIFOXYB2_FULL_38_15]OGF42137.1 MAG: membrane protein insertion efficiency factor YidD [Candidatus Falkowbacteria bacterium RIFOXYD2_FULL_39_16]